MGSRETVHQGEEEGGGENAQCTTMYTYIIYTYIYIYIYVCIYCIFVYVYIIYMLWYLTCTIFTYIIFNINNIKYVGRAVRTMGSYSATLAAFHVVPGR